MENIEKVENPVKPKTFCDKVTNCGLVLYPDCEHHVRLMAMFDRRENMYHPVYILHDRDVWTESDELPEGVTVGERKKPHWHVLLHFDRSGRSLSGLKKFLNVPYIERISDVDAYLSYMMHDTPSSWHKVQYSVSELHGDRKLVRRVTKQNANFVQ